MPSIPTAPRRPSVLDTIARQPKLLNLTRISPRDSEPYHVAELRGPDGLRYVASIFSTHSPILCSVVCVPAPMRTDHLRHNWAAWLGPLVADFESQRIRAQGN